MNCDAERPAAERNAGNDRLCRRINDGESAAGIVGDVCAPECRVRGDLERAATHEDVCNQRVGCAVNHLDALRRVIGDVHPVRRLVECNPERTDAHVHAGELSVSHPDPAPIGCRSNSSPRRCGSSARSPPPLTGVSPAPSTQRERLDARGPAHRSRIERAPRHSGAESSDARHAKSNRHDAGNRVVED